MTERKVKPDKQWMNGKVQKLLTARHYALSHNQHDTLPQLKSQLKCEIRRAKRTYAARVEQSFQTNNKHAWGELKSLLKMKKSTSNCHLSPDLLNNFYCRFEKEICPPTRPSLSDSPPKVTCDEVTKSLRCINSKKSTGPDGIPGRLLKLTAGVLGEPLCNLFNNCIDQGVYPDIWKSSTIIPIPKLAGASEAKDFRPVALTSTISKTFERLLLRFVTPCLTDNMQFAYRPGRSTEDAVAHLLDVVTAHLASS